MTSAASLAPPAARWPAVPRRQQLIRLSGEGWTRLRDASWEPTARACLDLWAERGLPLVVTRQPPPGEGVLAAGLPAPARFRRLRLPLGVSPRDVLFFDEFPPADAVTRLLPRAAFPAWRDLLAALAAIEVAPRAYGSYGWQALTRLAYVHARSDLDLLLPVSSAAQADAVVDILSCAGADPAWAGPRLDGELLFPDGAATAWREWQAWRDGRVAQVLVKRLHGVALETPGPGPA
jgi:phosphoribosyl-dephospho-CoA transferase